MISYKSQKRLAYFLFACFVITAIILLGADKRNITSLAEGNNDGQPLSIKISESLKYKIPEGANNIRIWIPLPAADGYQSVESLKIKSPWSYKIIKDPDFNNKVLFIALDNTPEKKSQAIIKWEYRVVRREQKAFSMGANYSFSNELYLNERGLEIIDDRIREIAKTVTDQISDPLEKAKALYNYVLTNVDYDTSVAGWGKGDVVYVCNVGKGNCTDFHSLFISLSRAAGIPARFRIGYPIPSESAGKLLKPYHCWAEFFIEGKGWIPVDISEAWKYPDKADYYFGNIDKYRILISTGREISLLPEGPTLNYFVTPYVEFDGKRYEHFEIERSFVKNI
ncbi:MAG: transglutaminase domain-containing protein [Ignavibacteria bacterium]|nr:transglutaminase domain-containing protein [Ignavibacteria bacterium]